VLSVMCALTSMIARAITRTGFWLSSVPFSRSDATHIPGGSWCRVLRSSEGGEVVLARSRSMSPQETNRPPGRRKTLDPPSWPVKVPDP